VRARLSCLATATVSLLAPLAPVVHAAPGTPDAVPVALTGFRGFQATYDVTAPTPDGERQVVWEVEQRPDVRHGIEVWRRVIRQPGSEPVIDTVYLARGDGGFVAKEVRSPGGIDLVEARGDSIRHVHVDPIGNGTDPTTSWIRGGARCFDAGSWDVLAVGRFGPVSDGDAGAGADAGAGGDAGGATATPVLLAAALVDPVPGLGTAIPLELVPGPVESVALPSGATYDARRVGVSSAYFEATVWVIDAPPYVVRAEMGGHRRVLREVRTLEAW